MFSIDFIKTQEKNIIHEAMNKFIRKEAREAVE